MKKHLKKLALRKEVVRGLESNTLQNVVGGISGTRICHTLNDNCSGDCGGSGGATCTSGAPNCGTGLVSQRLC